MKFKMAPNSLFAILLRSPWWISIAIALAFTLISTALLPAELRAFGAMGGFPFLVIGAIALRRQWNAPSARQVEAVQQALAGMGWPAFSQALVQGFERQGYVVERLTGAADLLLLRNGRHTVVAAKRWKAARIGEDALQALQQATRERDASAGVYVALGELTPQARRFAEQHRIELLQGPALAQLLRGVSLPSS
ncbi:restriction endonuclease [Ramlibacter sp. AN1015]|uniref:restriction endonuclease n=1 Tax=Ramlibacter sp. AN1015 TaxID=3133428 RepID=UPI0030BEF8C2